MVDIYKLIHSKQISEFEKEHEKMALEWPECFASYFKKNIEVDLKKRLTL